MNLSDITVVIAAKNEAPTLAAVIAGCRKYANRIIVVDGNSTDGTVDIARAAGADVLTDNGRGKGDAVRVGIAAVATDIVVLIDADGSHDPDDIAALVSPILEGRADHVTGSRLTGGSSELHGGFDEFMRLAGSAFITACINWRFSVCLSDSQNGFRAVRTAVVRQLGLRENLTTIEQEMIMKTLALGYRMGEVPAHEHRRAHGASHIVLWRVAPAYVLSLAKGLLAARRPARASERPAAASEGGPILSSSDVYSHTARPR